MCFYLHEDYPEERIATKNIPSFKLLIRDGKRLIPVYYDTFSYRLNVLATARKLNNHKLTELTTDGDGRILD